LARTRKKKVRRIRKKVQVKNKKVNYSLYIAFFVVLAIVLAVVYIFSNVGNPNYGGTSNENQATNSPQTGTRTSIGGFCKLNSECFVTYCKGQSRDCINSTQMATYSQNCKSYSDWVVENKQDYSVCSCVQNACTLLK
jgi:hypothetical protein